jgi:hypothetical protein
LALPGGVFGCHDPNTADAAWAAAPDCDAVVAAGDAEPFLRGVVDPSLLA